MGSNPGYLLKSSLLWSYVTRDSSNLGFVYKKMWHYSLKEFKPKPLPDGCKPKKKMIKMIYAWCRRFIPYSACYVFQFTITSTHQDAHSTRCRWNPSRSHEHWIWILWRYPNTSTTYDTKRLILDKFSTLTCCTFTIFSLLVKYKIRVFCGFWLKQVCHATRSLFYCRLNESRIAHCDSTRKIVFQHQCLS